MMPIVRGLGLTFAAFAAAFALHVVGGATDQGWLFALAVALIYAIATGFPAIALWVSRLPYKANETAKFIYGAGVVIGTGLTLGALWATNDRAFAAWHFPVSIILVAVVSAVLLLVRSRVDAVEIAAARRATS